MTLNQNPEGMLSQKLAESVYTPESQLRNPKELFRSMWNDLLASRELAWRLIVRNVSAKYRKTVLGYLWAFLPPIFTTVTFVFLNSQKMIEVEKTNIPYPAFVLIGMVLWQLFTETLSSPLRIINQSKSFITKIYFPREALIIAGVGEVTFNFFIRLLLILVVLFVYKVPVTKAVFFAPFGIMSLLALGLVFGVLLVPMGVLYEDIEKGLPLITTIWMFLTPVIYPMPEGFPASLLYIMNPVSPLLNTSREMLTTGSLFQIKTFCFINILTFSFLFISWILYRVALPYLVERMSS